MKTLGANGVTLAYEDQGNGDPPFLFVHGLAGNRTMFADQLVHHGPATGNPEFV